MRIYHHGFSNELSEITDYMHVVKGQCHGTIIRRRDAVDPHVLIDIMVEDDGLWHTPPSGGFSSHWLPDYIEVMEKTLVWLETHCIKDPSGFGWQARS